MKHSHLMPFLAVAAAAALPHSAFAAPSASDRQAFQLGYAMEYVAQTGADYVNQVARLKVTTEEEESHREAQLAGESDNVRQQQRNGVLQAVAAAKSLSGSSPVESWLQHQGGVLALPLKPAPEASDKDSDNAKQILATVDEISNFTAETRDQFPNVVTVVKLHAGDSGLWSFKAGQMLADIGSDTAPRSPIAGRVQELLDTAPASAGAALKEKLRALLPGSPPKKISAGVGNLSSLLPDAPVRADDAVEARNAFLQEYGLTDLPAKLSQN